MTTNVLMVCLGNICRSPLAEGILADKLSKNQFKIESAGTSDYHIGRPADPRSIAVAKKYKIDIVAKRAKQFCKADFQEYDHIFVMDQNNLKNVRTLADNDAERKKVSLIMDVLFPEENVDVPDPYFGLENGFEIVFKMLDEACDKIAKKLNSK